MKLQSSRFLTGCPVKFWRFRIIVSKKTEKAFSQYLEKAALKYNSAEFYKVLSNSISYSISISNSITNTEEVWNSPALKCAMKIWEGKNVLLLKSLFLELLQAEARQLFMCKINDTNQFHSMFCKKGLDDMICECSKTNCEQIRRRGSYYVYFISPIKVSCPMK